MDPSDANRAREEQDEPSALEQLAEYLPSPLDLIDPLGVRHGVREVADGIDDARELLDDATKALTIGAAIVGVLAVGIGAVIWWRA